MSKRRESDSPKVSALIGFFEKLNKSSSNSSFVELSVKKPPKVSVNRRLIEAKYFESPSKEILKGKTRPIKKINLISQNGTFTEASDSLEKEYIEIVNLTCNNSSNLTDSTTENKLSNEFEHSKVEYNLGTSLTENDVSNKFGHSKVEYDLGKSLTENNLSNEFEHSKVEHDLVKSLTENNLSNAFEYSIVEYDLGESLTENNLSNKFEHSKVEYDLEKSLIENDLSNEFKHSKVAYDLGKSLTENDLSNEFKHSKVENNLGKSLTENDLSNEFEHSKVENDLGKSLTENDLSNKFEHSKTEYDLRKSLTENGSSNDFEQSNAECYLRKSFTDSPNDSFEFISAENIEIISKLPEPASSTMIQSNERDCRTDSSYFSNDEDELEDGPSRPNSLDIGLDSSYELIEEYRILSPTVTEKMPIYENITINFNRKEGERIIELQRHNEHRESVNNYLEETFNRDHFQKARVSKTKKDYIIEELIQTEESYLKNLEHIRNNYIEFMKEHNVINYKDIYGNIENIYLETEIFYADLIACGDNHEDIGKIFIRHKNLFNRYPSYCKNKKRSESLMLETYYSDIIHEREATTQDHLGLSSYLLAPIQRLAKYEQLLKNLYKYLKSNDVATDELESAILLIQRISRTSNDIIILDSIENNEFSFNSTGQFIEKESFRMHSPRKMDVVLFMFQKIIIFAAQNPKNSENYIYKSHIPVDALSRKSEPDSVIFTLENFYKRKKHKDPQYILEARSLEIKNNWIEKIEKILWDQLYKYKDEMNKNFSSTQGNCDQIRLVENSETCDSCA